MNEIPDSANYGYPTFPLKVMGSLTKRDLWRRVQLNRSIKLV